MESDAEMQVVLHQHDDTPSPVPPHQTTKPSEHQLYNYDDADDRCLAYHPESDLERSEDQTYPDLVDPIPTATTPRESPHHFEGSISPAVPFETSLFSHKAAGEERTQPPRITNFLPYDICHPSGPLYFTHHPSPPQSPEVEQQLQQQPQQPADFFLEGKRESTDSTTGPEEPAEISFEPTPPFPPQPSFPTTPTTADLPRSPTPPPFTHRSPSPPPRASEDHDPNATMSTAPKAPELVQDPPSKLCDFSTHSPSPAPQEPRTKGKPLDYGPLLDFSDNFDHNGFEPAAQPKPPPIGSMACMTERRTGNGDISTSSPATSPDSTTVTPYNDDVFTPLKMAPSATTPDEKERATIQDISDLASMIEKVNLRSAERNSLNDYPAPNDTGSHQHAKQNGHHEPYPKFGAKEEPVVAPALPSPSPETQQQPQFGTLDFKAVDQPKATPTQDLASPLQTPQMVQAETDDSGHSARNGKSTTPVTIKSPTATKKASHTAPAKTSTKAATSPVKASPKVPNGIDHHHEPTKAKAATKLTATPAQTQPRAHTATSKPKSATRKTDYSHVQSKCGSLSFIKGAPVPVKVVAKETTKLDAHDHSATNGTSPMMHNGKQQLHTPASMSNGGTGGVGSTKRATPMANKTSGLVANGTALGHSPNHQVPKKASNLKGVQSKIGSLENANYKPVKIEKKIETVKLDFKGKAKSKIGSLDNAAYVSSGGNIKVQSHKLNFKETAAPKVQTKFAKSPQATTSPLVETGGDA